MQMIDSTQSPTLEEESSRTLKALMGKTPGILKTKLLSVLGSSNEILNDFSNRLDEVLTLSSSSGSDRSQANGNDEDDTHSRTTYEHGDDELFDFEICRIKERRAHEEVLSGKYRQPNYNIPSDTTSLEEYEDANSSPKLSSYAGDTISDSSPSDGIIASRSIQSDRDDELSHTHLRPPKFLLPSISTESGAASKNDSTTAETGETTENVKSCERSDSYNSMPSTVSSLSLDSQIEESSYDFMKKFVKILFRNNEDITPELKAEFGKLAMTDTGRMWFSRLINMQRIKSKRINETTFFGLVQSFAIILFECSEADDFSPAKNLMNMCFTFYHEVDVPGCEPYREYLYNYLRDQPIWASLRFWSAAFFDAIQCERSNRPIPKLNDQSCQSLNELSQKSSSSSHSSTVSSREESLNMELLEDQTFLQNITFGQLGTFTCNMHAFGLSKELCVEFLRKQCTIGDLSDEQEKMLRDNINRMYKETDKWRE